MKNLFNLFAVMVVVAIPRLEAQPVITQQPTNQTVLAGGNATFGVSVSGTGPFTYQWQLNNTNLPNGIITTVAGNGTSGSSGDGGAATNAALNNPSDVAIDASGNLFIAVYFIRKVATDGIISTITTNAGYGTSSVAIDASGTLFIVDSGINCIRKMDTNGIITAVAGNGSASFSGDGGAATNAALNFPQDVVVDASGNLFIADFFNSRIRKVATSGIITTVAGNGAFSFSGDGGAATNAALYLPSCVGLDASGNLFIADYGNKRIRKVTTNGIITTVAGNGTRSFSGDGGAATNAALNYPNGVGLDASGNLFIADSGNNRIRKVDTNGIITTVAGNGTGSFSGDGGAATNAALNNPGGVVVDAGGNMFIVDNYNQRIRKVDHSASQPTLKLNAVTTNNAGNYSVIVTGASGSVTSSVASLTITLPPGYNQVTGEYLDGGNMRLSFVGNSGGNYALDRSFSLAPPNWIPQVTNPADAGGSLVFTNTPDPTTNNFWRVRSVP